MQNKTQGNIREMDSGFARLWHVLLHCKYSQRKYLKIKHNASNSRYMALTDVLWVFILRDEKITKNGDWHYLNRADSGTNNIYLVITAHERINHVKSLD